MMGSTSHSWRNGILWWYGRKRKRMEESPRAWVWYPGMPILMGMCICTVLSFGLDQTQGRDGGVLSYSKKSYFDLAITSNRTSNSCLKFIYSVLHVFVLCCVCMCVCVFIQLIPLCLWSAISQVFWSSALRLMLRMFSRHRWCLSLFKRRCTTPPIDKTERHWFKERRQINHSIKKTLFH